MEIRLPYQWSPRPYQQAVWDYLREGGTRAVVCAHRRWGKDEVSLHHTVCAAHERVGNYGHMLPEYAQGRKAIWDAVNPHSGTRRIDEAFPVALRANVSEQEMKIRFKNHSTWQVCGSDNYNSLMGTSFAGIVKSEEALSNPSAWGYLSPILRENHGWALFISTPRGRNHFHALLQTAQREPGWFGQISQAADTQVFTPEELQEECRVMQDLHGADYGAALFEQEYACSFDAAIPGSIWGDCVTRAEEEGRILDFEIDRSMPVHTAYDLGRTDDTSIWWYQICGRRIDIFDHEAGPGWDLHNPLQRKKSLVHLLEDRREQHGITYADHHLPHDARPRTLAAGGKSIYQQLHGWADLDPRLGRFLIGKRLDKQEHIQAGRATFPFCRFHKTRTAKGVTSLRQYHREWDDEKKIFADTPEHDWASHDADSFMELATSWKMRDPTREDSPLIDRLLATNPPAMSFGVLKDQHFRGRRRARQEAS